MSASDQIEGCYLSVGKTIRELKALVPPDAPVDEAQ
jgi:hypothetical protein